MRSSARAITDKRCFKYCYHAAHYAAAFPCPNNPASILHTGGWKEALACDTFYLQTALT